MSEANYVRYLGDNDELPLRMKPLAEQRAWQWTIFTDLDDLLDDCHGRTLRSSQWGESDARCSIQRAYAPVILEIAHAASAARILRELKSINRGISVIILSEQASLTSFSLALLDGSEAFFHKPLASLSPLWDAVDQANRRVQRWTAALEHSRAGYSLQTS